MGRLAVVVAAAAMAVTASGVEGQYRGSERWEDPDALSEPRAWVSVGIVAADPVGELAEVIDGGFGLAASGSLPIAADGAFALRGGLGFVIYGHESRAMCFGPPIGCRIGVDLVTTNDIFFGEIGPELARPRGTLRPYVNASFGFSYFSTTSRLSGLDEWDSFGDTRNFDDLVASVGAGAGLRTQLRGGRKPLYLDLGVRYHRNGQAEYLRSGDIEDHPDGSITIHPNRSEANLLQYQLGVTFGIPRGGDDHDRPGRDRGRGRR